VLVYLRGIVTCAASQEKLVHVDLHPPRESESAATSSTSSTTSSTSGSARGISGTTSLVLVVLVYITRYD
jgi:hypothetical protein